MAELPKNEIPYETIVITDNGRNAAALSATRRGGHIYLRSFSGSNTFENLKKMGRFSVNYITPDKKYLFLRAALSGWGDDEREFTEEIEKEPFPHMREAEGWAVCIPEKIETGVVEDEIGKTEVLYVDAKVLMWIGSAKNSIKVGADRNMMALVAYTRYLISSGNVREKYGRKVLELAEEGDEIGSHLLKLVKGF